MIPGSACWSISTQVTVRVLRLHGVGSGVSMIVEGLLVPSLHGLLRLVQLSDRSLMPLIIMAWIHLLLVVL